MNKLLFKGILIATDKKFKAFESKLFSIIFENWAANFIQDDDGKFRFSKNLLILNDYERIREQIQETQKGLLSYIVKSIKRLFKDSSKKYKSTEKKGIFDVLEKSSERNVVDTQGNLEDLYREIQQKIIGKLSAKDGATLKEIREDLKGVIKDDRIYTKYYGRWTHDIYTKYQRIATNEIRKGLGLRFAIYQGGEIETTRDHCDEYNDRVLSEDEIKEWRNMSWGGKNKEPYDPFTDAGGYNCRHTFDWISDELAFRLRPELREIYG